MYPAQFPLAFSTVVSFLGRLDSRANSPSPSSPIRLSTDRSYGRPHTRPRTHQHRLQNTALPQRARQCLERSLVEVTAHLREIRLDQANRQLSQLL
jgi:hypothetical protein